MKKSKTDINFCASKFDTPIRREMKNCVFCKKIKTENLSMAGSCVYFEPLNPVTKGHLLVVPIKHCDDFSKNWEIASTAMVSASIIAKKIGGDFNLITSKGKNATQTIKHLHIHLVPRRKNDGLKLPWVN